MAKRGSLFASEATPELKRQEELQAPRPEPQTPVRPPSRQGKSAVTFYVDPAAAKQLKRLCVDEDASVQGLMVEALNDFFAKRGLNRIA